MTLSIIIPAYNEEKSIGQVLNEVLSLSGDGLDLIVVNDGSGDRTAAVVLEAAQRDPRVRLLRHRKNLGKGSAIRTALPHVRGDLVVIQDGDMENDPRDLLEMKKLFKDPQVTVVYGSRWLREPNRRLRWTSYLAGAALSWLTNRLYGSRITDEPTCYKMFRSSLLKSIQLHAAGFGFCPEVTAKVLLAGHEIHEIPIAYRPRRFAEGKKIRVRDGFIAIGILIFLKFQDVLKKTLPYQWRASRLEH